MTNHYEQVPDDEPLEEGETYESIYRIEVPSWLPGDDVAAQLIGDAIGLNEEINSRLGQGNQIDIKNKELRETDDPGVYHYVIRYEVVSVNENDPVTSASIGGIIYAILAAAIVVGIAVSLMETRKIVQTEGGSGVLMAGIAVLGYGLYTANKQSSGSG